MSDMKKLSLAFLAMSGCAIALIVVGALQEREIAKLKRENQAFRKVLTTVPGIILVQEVLKREGINRVLETVVIPDDLSGM